MEQLLRVTLMANAKYQKSAIPLRLLEVRGKSVIQDFVQNGATGRTGAVALSTQRTGWKTETLKTGMMTVNWVMIE
jgi:hypothetical protein